MGVRNDNSSIHVGGTTMIPCTPTPGDRCSFSNEYGVHCVRLATSGDRCAQHRPTTPTPECSGDDNCIECCPEVEVSMPGTIAALTAKLAAAEQGEECVCEWVNGMRPRTCRSCLRSDRDDWEAENDALTAELTQTKDERDALLHVRHTLTAELHAVSEASGRRMDGWREAEQRARAAEAERDGLKRELTMIEHRGPHFLLSDARDRGHQWAARAKAAEAERDRYRDALERIEHRMAMAMVPGNDKVREIEGSLIDARAALTNEGAPE